MKPDVLVPGKSAAISFEAVRPDAVQIPSGDSVFDRRTLIITAIGTGLAAVAGVKGMKIFDMPAEVIEPTNSRSRDLLLNLTEENVDGVTIDQTPFYEAPGMPYSAGKYVYLDKALFDSYKDANKDKSLGVKILGTKQDIEIYYSPDTGVTTENVEIVTRLSKDDAGNVVDQNEFYRMTIDPRDWTGNLSLQYYQDGLDVMPEYPIPPDFATYVPPDGNGRVDFEGKTISPAVPEDIYHEAKVYAHLLPQGEMPHIVVLKPEPEDELVNGEPITRVESIDNVTLSTVHFENNYDIDVWRFAIQRKMSDYAFDHINALHDFTGQITEYSDRLTFVMDKLSSRLGEQPTFTQPDNWPSSLDFTLWNYFFHPGSYDERFIDTEYLISERELVKAIFFIASDEERSRELVSRWEKTSTVTNSQPDTVYRVEDESERGVIDFAVITPIRLLKAAGEGNIADVLPGYRLLESNITEYSESDEANDALGLELPTDSRKERKKNGYLEQVIDS